MARDNPRTGAARARSGIARRPLRVLAAAALVTAVAALAFVVLARDTSREYRVIFSNAGQLVPGDLVRIGGVPAGIVKGLDLTPDGQAEVRISIDEEWGALHAGTTVTVRASGIATVTGRYVDVSPGPSFRPAIEEGAAIDVDHTRPIVDIDQLLNTFDRGTRRSVQHVLNGFGTWYDGREAQANESARYFPAALQSATHLFDELNRDSETLEEFIVQTGTALGALARRRDELTSLISTTRSTARALGADNESLSAALVNLPPALREGSDTLAAVRPALGDLGELIDASDPVSRELAPFLRDLQPVVSRAVPAFRDFRLTFDRPGKSDDLLDALRTLPSLGRTVDSAFPQAEKTLGDSTPVLGFVRPYAPDLVAWIRQYGSAAATYDANGHYARTVPIFDAFNFSDDADGGTLTAKTQSERGSSPYLTTGNTRRCPGANLPALSDGSAPFVDEGPLAVPDCDPKQVIR